MHYVIAILDKNHASSRFRGMVYNRFPKELTKEQKKFAQQNVPQVVNGAPTYLHKYLNAMKDNPKKDDYYVTQINSVEELNERVKQIQQATKQAHDRIKKTKENLTKVRDLKQTQIQDKLIQNF